MRIASIGGVLIDLIETLPATQPRRVLGGVCGNIARLFKRNNFHTGLFSVIGKEDIYLEKSLISIGLDPYLIRAEGETATTTNLFGSQGELLHDSFESKILDEFTDPSPWKEPLSNHQVWIIDTNLKRDPIETLISYANPDTLIFCTIAVLEKTDRLPNDLSRVKGVFMNLQELELLSGISISSKEDVTTACEPLFAKNANIIFVTNGPHGAFAITKDALHFQNAIPISFELTNTHGAGDSFTTGVIIAILENKELKDCLSAGLEFAYSYLEEQNLCFV